MHQTGIRPALPVREPYPVAGWPPPFTSSQNVPIRLSKSRRRTILRQLPSHLRGATTPASLWPAHLPNLLRTRNLGQGRWYSSSPRVKKVRRTQPLQKNENLVLIIIDIIFSFQIFLPESDWEAENSKSSSKMDAGLQNIPQPKAMSRLGKAKISVILLLTIFFALGKCFLSVQVPLSSHPQLKTGRIMKSLTSRNKR